MLTLTEMFKMQAQLTGSHPEWKQYKAESGPYKLLWMLGEAGEIIDIVKKKDEYELVGPSPVHDHLVEEIVDVQMYLIDVMACYGITPEEFSAGFAKKHKHNMIRDYAAENRETK